VTPRVVSGAIFLNCPN